MITLTKRPIEKLPLPQLRDLKVGETFYLPDRPDQVYAVTDYDGEDFVGHRAWREGSQEAANRTFEDYIETIRENMGRDKCTSSYRVVIRLSNFDTDLIHEAVEVVPVHCEVIYHEAANYNI
jgi:hypothetical protein